MEEQKRYRNSFILLTLTAVAGILIGLYLYEYTDYFSALRADADASAVSGFDLRALILDFFDEIKLTVLLLTFGFTLFSSYVAIAVLGYKGFMTGFSVLYFGIYYERGIIGKPQFVLSAFALILILMIYIITGARSVAFSGSLRYAAPDLRSLLQRKSTCDYIAAFLFLSAFLLVIMAFKHTIPLIKL